MREKVTETRHSSFYEIKHGKENGWNNYWRNKLEKGLKIDLQLLRRKVLVTCEMVKVKEMERSRRVEPR